MRTAWFASFAGSIENALNAGLCIQTTLRSTVPNVQSRYLTMRTERRLRNYVEDEEIYLLYFGEFELGTKYHSPFRRDPRPSFKIDDHKGLLYWKDFGLTSPAGSDALAFVQQLYGVDRQGAVNIVWRDFLEDSPTLPKRKRTLNISLPMDVRCRELRDFELSYWQEHCVERELLGKFNIKGVASIHKHGNLLWESTPAEPMFYYDFGGPYKIYRPKSENRFLGSGNGDIIEGYAQLPNTGRSLIVTSSMKDAIVLTSLGYSACSPASETNLRAVKARAREFNERFSAIYVLFDNDAPGRKAAKALTNITGWTAIFIPKEVAKDPADVVKKFGNRFALSNFLRKFVP